MPIICKKRKLKNLRLSLRLKLYHICGTPKEVPEKYNAESPLFHVTARSPPTFLAHNCNDAHVCDVQSVAIKRELDEHQVKNYLLTIPWGTHGFEYNLNGSAGQLSMYSLCRFFYSVTQMKK